MNRCAECCWSDGGTMQIARVSRNTPTTFRSVRFACTDAGQSMRQNLEGSKQFRWGHFVGLYLPEAPNCSFLELPRTIPGAMGIGMEHGLWKEMPRRVLIIDAVPEILM